MKYNVLTWMVLTANWLNYVVASEGYGIRGVDEITDWKKVRRMKRKTYDLVVASCLSRDLVFELACICTFPCQEKYYLSKLMENSRH